MTSPTLRQTFADYQIHSGLKLSSLGRYACTVEHDLADWLDVPLLSIRPGMIEAKQKELVLRSETAALTAAKVIRSLFAFAQSHYKISDADAPGLICSPLTVAHLDSRRNQLSPEDLAAIIQATFDSDSDVRDWLLLVLLTGVSRKSICNLPWNAVDLENKFFVLSFPAPSRFIPMTEKVASIFHHRRSQRGESLFVFSNPKGNAPADIASRSYMAVSRQAGINFTPSDLASTFVRTSEKIGVDLTVLPAASLDNGAPSAYLLNELEILRESYRRVEASLLRLVNIKTTQFKESPLPVMLPAGIREDMPSLGEAWAAYSRVSRIKSSTKRSHSLKLAKHVGDWFDLPLTSITKQMVLERHLLMSQTAPRTANLVMAILRSVFNFSIAYFDNQQGQALITQSPVSCLTAFRRWNKNERKTRFLKRHQVKTWLTAVEGLVNDCAAADQKTIFRSRHSTYRDLLLFVLFTGCRKSEALKLTWNDVDLNYGLVTFIQTKNGTDHTLPLPDNIWTLLSKRAANATRDVKHVFPGKVRGRSLADTREATQLVSERSGIEFSLHDLRRTFASQATVLGVNAYNLKRLLNHSMANDVTAGYVRLDPEDLRPHIQNIANAFLSCEASTSRQIAGIKAKEA